MDTAKKVILIVVIVIVAFVFLTYCGTGIVSWVG